MKERFREIMKGLYDCTEMAAKILLKCCLFCIFLLYFLFFCISCDSYLDDRYKSAKIAAQYQTPMDEKYVGLRWESNEWRKIEVMYFDIVKEGEPPRGVCVFDGVAYDVMLVGPFGAEGMDSRDYYVVPADTEITDEVPEEYMFYGHLHWEVGKKAFYYSFDSQNEDYVSTLDFRPIKIPVDAIHGA